MWSGAGHSLHGQVSCGSGCGTSRHAGVRKQQNRGEAKKQDPRKNQCFSGVFVRLRECSRRFNAPTGIRTLDLLIKSQLLYQLSYRSLQFLLAE